MQVKRVFSQAALAGALLVAVGMPAAAADGDSSGFFIAPEAVYFSFTESDFNYATIGPFDAEELDGDVKRINNDYNLGWRLGLGYRWDNDWDFTARWTHIDGDASSWVQASGDDYLFLDQDPFEYYDYLYNGYAEADSDQGLDYVDLTVGRTFTSEKGHSARFFAGMRWAQFDQSFDVLYVDNDDDEFDSDDDAYSTFQNSDYTGWGVVAGAEGHLALGDQSDWSLFGSVAFAVLMGNTDQDRVDADWYFGDYPDLSEADIVIDAHDSFDSTTTSIEAQLGVEWAHQYDGIKTGIRFGWEVQSWSGVGTLQHYTGYDQQSGRSDGTGNIGLMGAFVRATFGW